MLKKIKTFLTGNTAGKRFEHYAVIFAGAFGLTALATAEKAAGAHGFQWSWSFAAGVALAGAKAGDDAVRPAVLSLFANAAK